MRACGVGWGPSPCVRRVRRVCVCGGPCASCVCVGAGGWARAFAGMCGRSRACAWAGMCGRARVPLWAIVLLGGRCMWISHFWCGGYFWKWCMVGEWAVCFWKESKDYFLLFAFRVCAGSPVRRSHQHRMGVPSWEPCVVCANWGVQASLVWGKPGSMLC